MLSALPPLPGVEPAPPAIPPTPTPEVPAAEVPPPPPIEVPPAEPAEPEELVFDEEIPGAETPAPEAAKPVVAEPAKPPVSPEEQAAMVEGLSPEDQVVLQKIIDQHGKGAHALETVLLRTNRGRRMVQALKTQQALEAPPEDGGIGHVPTIEQIRDYHQAHVDLQTMVHEFEANPLSWTLNFFGKDIGSGQPRAGAAEVLGNLPAVLAQHAPEMLGALVNPILSRYNTRLLNDLYQRAVSVPEGQGLDARTGIDDRTRSMDVARILEFYLTGQTRPAPAATGPAAADPLAPERQRLQREQEAVQQERAGIQQTRVAQFESSAATEIDRVVMHDINSVLKARGFLDAFPEGSFQLTALRDRLRDQVYDRVAGNAQRGTQPLIPTQFQNFRVQLDRAQRAFLGTGKSDFAAPVRTYRQMVQQVLKRLAPELGAAVTTAKQVSDDRHAQLALAAGRPAPAPGGGAPVPQSILPALPARQPGETQDEWTSRQIRERLALAGYATR